MTVSMFQNRRSVVNSKLTGINVVKKRDEKGNVKKEYHYAWKGKGAPQLPGKPGSDEYCAAYFAAKTPKRGDPDTLLSLFKEYEDSIEFHDLAPLTKDDYRRTIKILREEFGDMPKAGLLDSRARGTFLNW